MSKVWLVTGGSRSLGRALAEAALAAGDLVVATARRPEGLADLVDRHGERLRAVGPDAVAPEAARGAVAAAVEAFGRLDVVVNNPGYTNVGPIGTTPLEELEAQIAGDLWGPVRVAHAALPVMRAQGAGHIVLASMVGRRTYPPLGAYRTTARALEGFSEAVAEEAAPSGIHVTIVERGGIGTDGPAEAARAIMRLVAEERPPLRLSLGDDPARLAEIGACSIRCEQYAR
jgi:NAD(P)-dependent dehydrogenase (short-subunit alcohol dehydrogenase family)